MGQITAEQYRKMSNYEKAQISPRHYETLLFLESVDNISDFGKAALEKYRAPAPLYVKPKPIDLGPGPIDTYGD